GYLVSVAPLQADLVAPGLATGSLDPLPRLFEVHFPSEESLPGLAQRLLLGNARDGLRGAVEGGDAPVGVDRDQPRADRLEAQIPERLEIGIVLALVFEAALREVIALGKRAGQEGDGEQHGRVQEDGEHLERGWLTRLGQSEEGQNVAAEHDVDVEKTCETGRDQ